jgi:hypothetical protein
MEYNELEDGRIAVPFIKTNGKYTFNDALVMTLEEYQQKTSEELEAIMQQRFDNWLAIITYVPPEEQTPA